MNSRKGADVPLGAAMPLPDRDPTATAVRQDAFYGGRFGLLQPVERGFRSGLDALLLAAALPVDAAGSLADLGSGAGAVGLAAACRASGVAVTLVEHNPVMGDLARRTLALDVNRAFRPRLAVIQTDVLGQRAQRESAGLSDGAFDHVLTNPPYHSNAGRISPDALRAAAMVASDPEFLPRWFQVAAAVLAHGGRFAAILRTDAVPQGLAAATSCLGAIRILPVHTIADKPARRVMLSATKGSRAAFAILPGIVLNTSDGRPTAISEAIAQGTATLSLDA